MIRKDLLENVHKTIMKESSTKENPTPHDWGGRGSWSVEDTFLLPFEGLRKMNGESMCTYAKTLRIAKLVDIL